MTLSNNCSIQDGKPKVKMVHTVDLMSEDPEESALTKGSILTEDMDLAM